MHRLTNCNYNLFKWKLQESPYCKYCNIHIDTIEHHFYLCAFSKEFWEKLGKYLTNILDLENTLDFTICEIMFGTGLRRNLKPINSVLNMAILVGKWYINNCKTNDKKLFFLEFTTTLYNKMLIYKDIYSTAVGVEQQIFKIIQETKWES